jgi:haloacetate dehalogenase
VHDRADVAAGHRLAQPLRVLWGDNGIVGKCFEVLKLWRERAADVSGRGVESGHYLAEEAPQEVLDEAFGFFRST